MIAILMSDIWMQSWFLYLAQEARPISNRTPIIGLISIWNCLSGSYKNEMIVILGLISDVNCHPVPNIGLGLTCWTLYWVQNCHPLPYMGRISILDWALYRALNAYPVHYMELPSWALYLVYDIYDLGIICGIWCHPRPYTGKFRALHRAGRQWAWNRT